MSEFEGSWEDDVVAGECENFEAFCDAFGMKPNEKEMFRNVKGSACYRVKGDDWEYDEAIAGMSKTFKIKMGTTRDEDTDLQGNKFISTFALEAPNKLLESKKLWTKDGRIIEIKDEKVVSGDKMMGAMTVLGKGDGVTLKYSMSRKK